jgi:CcmD family protein
MLTFLSIGDMKFHKILNFLIIILLQAIALPTLFAQGNRDFMRETGKINVVVGVVLLIFIGIAWYLFRLDRKLTKLEHQLNSNKNEWTN